MVTEKRTRLYTQRLNALLPSNSLIRLTLFKNLSDCVEFQECEQKIENFKKLLNTVEIGKDSSETENLVKKIEVKAGELEKIKHKMLPQYYVVDCAIGFDSLRLINTEGEVSCIHLDQTPDLEIEIFK